MCDPREEQTTMSSEQSHQKNRPAGHSARARDRGAQRS